MDFVAGMHRVAAAFVVVLAALAAGCTSISEATDAMRDRISGRDEARSRVFQAPQREVYQAVRLAAGKMGYRVLRGGAAQGYLEAVSGIGEGEVVRSSRQIEMKVALKSHFEGGTEVTVRLTEIVEAEGANRSTVATSTPLQGTPQYEVLFRSIQEALDQRTVDNGQ